MAYRHSCSPDQPDLAARGPVPWHHNHEAPAAVQSSRGTCHRRITLQHGLANTGKVCLTYPGPQVNRICTQQLGTKLQTLLGRAWSLASQHAPEVLAINVRKSGICAAKEHTEISATAGPRVNITTVDPFLPQLLAAAFRSQICGRRRDRRALRPHWFRTAVMVTMIRQRTLEVLVHG